MLNELFGKFDQIAKVGEASLPPILPSRLFLGPKQPPQSQVGPKD